MTTKFKPMLASDYNEETITFPKLASVKLDGIRCVIVDGVAYTRSMKPIKNEYIRAMLSRPEYDGLDGEILCAEPTDPDCYRKTNSAVMSIKGEPNFTFWVFDLHTRGTAPYQAAYKALHKLNGEPNIAVLEQRQIDNLEQLLEYEGWLLAQGHEGVMLRGLDSPYKQNRTTDAEQNLIKVKRFSSGEAVIIGVEEEMENTNEKVTNELGYSERSSHKDGMVGKNRLGALRVRDIHTDVEFSMGSGFDKDDRVNLWGDHEGKELIGRIVTYKYFSVGVKDKPRFPVFKGFRDSSDIS